MPLPCPPPPLDPSSRRSVKNHRRYSRMVSQTLLIYGIGMLVLAPVLVIALFVLAQVLTR